MTLASRLNHMVWKQTGQLGLADALATHHEALEELDDLHKLIDWKRIEHLLRHVHSSIKGEPAWHPVIMFKILLLQKMYNLSDPKMEKQLARDTSLTLRLASLKRYLIVF